MLGTIDQDAVDRALRAVAAGDARVAMAVVGDLVTHGLDCEGLLDELLVMLHRIALAQSDAELVDEAERARLLEHARTMSAEDVQLYYQIAALGRRDLGLAPDPRTGVEMTLLRMIAFRPTEAASETNTPRPARAAPATPASTTTAAASVPAAAPAVRAAEPEPASSPASTAPSANGWSEVVAALKLTGLVRELANNAVLESQTDDAIALVLDEACQQLMNKDREAVLKQALETYYGRPTKVTVRIGKPTVETPLQEKNRERDERQQAAVQSINSDPNVQALREKFNARVNPETIRPKSSNARQS